MLKIIKSITVSLLLISSLSAEVRFDLRFTDANGVGFNDPKNKWMIKAVQEGADILGKCIKQNAFVTVEVCSKEDGYATATRIIKKIESLKAKYITKAMDKILNENEKFSGIWEGKINFNTDKFLAKHTLKQIVIHELTHTLGLVSLIDPNSYSYFGFSFSDYDQLMVDNAGNHLIRDDLGWLWDDFKLNQSINFSSNIFACGPNIKKRNNGECLKLYNPTPLEPGSSFSHLDTETYPQNLLNHILNNGYPIWNKYEIGIMEDLGYQIDWDNYCKIVDNMDIKSCTLTIDMKALKGNNCYFKLIKDLKDFPEECASTEIFHDNFSIQFISGYQLQFFLNDHLIHEFKSINELKNKTLQISDKDYLIKSTFKSNNLNLTFIEI